MSTQQKPLRVARATARSLSTKPFRATKPGTIKRRPSQAVSRVRPWEVNNAAHQQQNLSSHPPQQPKQPKDGQQSPPEHHQNKNALLAATLAEDQSSELLSEVIIPNDPHGVLLSQHPALSILGNSSLVIQRQLEMMNVMLGLEQANRYIIMDGAGNTVGYIAEEDHGIGSSIRRQVFGSHRSFTTHIFDKDEREVLRIHRPFAWINSRIRIYDCLPEGGYGDMQGSAALQGLGASSVAGQPVSAQVSPLKMEDMRIIGECQQQWAPLRRKYDLFSYRPLKSPPQHDSTPRIESGEKPISTTTGVTLHSAPEAAIEAGMSQFAHVNEPFLSWDFALKNHDALAVGAVSRNWAGFGREFFTDTGVYALRMDSAAQSASLEDAAGEEVGRYERDRTAMTLDQRAVMLATAVSIDFDYFSRHSGAGTGFMPMFWPMGGGAAEGGAAGAGAGAAGAGAEAGMIGAGTGAAMDGAGAMEGVGTAAGAAGRGLGTAAGPAGESAIAGAGTMAGYEAMQRGVYGPRGGDEASPQAGQPPPENEPFAGDWQNASENRPGTDDTWGEGQDPWGGGGGGGGDGGMPPPSAGGEGGGEGGGWLDSLSDFFSDS